MSDVPSRRKTPTELLAEIALEQSRKRPSEPVSKVGATQGANGKWRGQVEVAHVDPFEAARIALELVAIIDPALQSYDMHF